MKCFIFICQKKCEQGINSGAYSRGKRNNFGYDNCYGKNAQKNKCSQRHYSHCASRGGCNAFSAFEAEKYRKYMTELNKKSRNGNADISCIEDFNKNSCKDNCDDSFKKIKNKNRNSCFFSENTKSVCCSRISAARFANVFFVKYF